MTITLDIPDDGRKFRALLGRELIAFVEDDILYIKTQSCNFCGECCMDNPGVDDDDEGRCRNLVKSGDKWECSMGVDVPWRCLDDPKGYDCCSIMYKKVTVR